MNIGSISWNSIQGISNLVREFYKNNIVNRVFTLNHPYFDNYPEQFLNSYSDKDEFLENLDILFLFEQPLNIEIVKEAEKRGLKIILMPMFEWTVHPFPVHVDLCICVSESDLEYYRDIYNCISLNVPVDKSWELRTQAKRFIHNAGHGQVEYCKGTPEICEAMKLVESDIILKIKYQPCLKMYELHKKYEGYPKIKWEKGDFPEEELYKDGDVFLYGEKIDGLALPIQEAFASGLLVMTPDRFPSKPWLPRESLITVSGYENWTIPGGSGFEIKRAIIDPQDIAKTIDFWYNCDIQRFSSAGKKWAEKNSWKVLRPKYLDEFEKLIF